MASKTHPVRNGQYTYSQMMAMYLDDTPHLMFQVGNVACTVQDSHITQEQLLTVPGFSALLWRYEYTNHEFIPIFKAVDNEAVLQCVDIEPLSDDTESLWVTPKGFPRERYVWVDEHEDDLEIE